jgi:hypothetical protein
MRALVDVLRRETAIANTARSDLEVEILRREREPQQRRGFFEIDADGRYRDIRRSRGKVRPEQVARPDE